MRQRGASKKRASKNQSPCHIDGLTSELLYAIFRRVEFHPRREVLPLVCKSWSEAAGPSSPIWDACELSAPPKAQSPPHAPGPGQPPHLSLTHSMRWHNVLWWFTQRAGLVKTLTVRMADGQAHDLAPSALGTLLVLLAGSLETLKVSDASFRVYDQSIWAAVSTARKLRRLEFAGARLDGAKLRQLGRLTELRHLKLNTCGSSCLTAGDSSALGDLCRQLPRLESVSLSTDRRQAERTGEDCFAHNTALTSLRLVNFERASGFEMLSNLKELSLKGSLQAPGSMPALDPAALTSLTSLDLSSNSLAEVPASVWVLSSLRALHLSHNSFVGWGSSDAQFLSSGLQNLTFLDLGDCGLRTVPNALASMVALAHLELGGNHLRAAPAAPYIGTLTYLGLERNRSLEPLCSEWAGATRLQTLELGGTDIVKAGLNSQMLAILGAMRRLRRVGVVCSMPDCRPRPGLPPHAHGGPPQAWQPPYDPWPPHDLLAHDLGESDSEEDDEDDEMDGLDYDDDDLYPMGI